MSSSLSSLDETDHTDAGLSLKDLELGGTKVTDAGVKELQEALPAVCVKR